MACVKCSIATALLTAWLLSSEVSARQLRNSISSEISEMESMMKHRSDMKRMHEMSKTKTMSGLFPFYHSTDDISAKLRELATHCPGMTLTSASASAATSNPGEPTSIDVVNIKSTGEAINKNFYLFGEHARELISPETGLHLVQSLCGENPDLADKARETLKTSEFTIIVNGNPHSRAKVEGGDFCLRINENGVDLNRNWDEKWQPSADFAVADTNPGPAPFSEPETRIFKQLVTDFEPTNFLTIHSGTRGMYMPWAYDMEHLATRNQPEMMTILKNLDKDYCECPFGAAGKEVGYSCPGTCLDWVYDKLDTPYSFAFEIYIGPEYDDGLKERWEEKMKNGVGAFYQLNSTLAHKHFGHVFEQNPSDFVQLKSNRQHESRLFEKQPMDCFGRFNPDTEDRFRETTAKWSSALMDLAQMVATNLKKDQDGGPSPAAGGVNTTVLTEMGGDVSRW